MSGILQPCPRCHAQHVRLLWDIQRNTTVCTRCQGVDYPTPTAPARTGEEKTL